MIITRITGGLGNQLFQYALGRVLADRYNVPLLFDTAEYRQWTLRPFGLGAFAIDADVASDRQTQAFLGWKRHIPRRFEGMVRSLAPFLYSGVTVEKSARHDPDVFSAGSNTYLIGFWQSEKYFLAIQKRIRSELVLKKPLSPKSKALFADIRKSNAVAIHIRRGEFVTDPRINKRHGALDARYYMNVMEFMAARIGNPHFFIFSDEIEWAKRYVKPVFPHTYCDFNYPGRIEEDLILSSCCRHHGIANSTFAWWAAWLNPHPGKIVVAPKRWFADAALENPDLLPSSWIRM